MTITIAQHMSAALAPLRDEALLSRKAVGQIANEVACHLPAAMTRLFGFECRLGEPSPVADFAINIDGQGEQWQALEAYASLQSEPAWARIGQLLKGRHDPQCAWHDRIDNLWLEYDLASRTASQTSSILPSVFLGTDHLVAHEANALDYAWVMASITELTGRALQSMETQGLGLIVKALPPRAQIFQVGVMLSRNDAPIRVCVGDVAPEDVYEFLGAVGWSGDLAVVKRALDEVLPFMSYLAFGFDISDDGISKKLGIEIYTGRDADSGQRLIGQINSLGNAGLLLPEKAAGLLAWCGIAHQRLHLQNWPADLLAERAARSLQDSSTFVRRISHFKISFDGDRAPTAKAYLATVHRFLTDHAIREAVQQMRGVSTKNYGC